MKYYKGKYIKKLNKGVYGVSLVKNPAMEGEAIFLNADEKRLQFKTVNEEQRIVLGMIMQPDFNVYRYDDKTGEEYYISFDAETIKELAHDFMTNGYNNNSSIEHKTKINGVSIVETWIVEDSEKDKTSVHGLNEKVGSWVGMMKIENNDVWENYVKSGKIGGFSIDAFVSLEEVKEEKNQLKDGTPITFSMMVKGTEVFYMDGSPLKTGKYELMTDIEIDVVDGVIKDMKEINLKSIEMSKEVLEESQKQTSILTELSSAIKSIFLNTDKKEEVVKVEFGSVKSKDGSVTFEFDGETMTPEGAIYVMTDDGQKVAVPVGEYELEDGSILVVETEGIIKEVKPAMTEAPANEEMTQEQPQSVQSNADLVNAIKSVLIKYTEEIKGELNTVKTELSELKKENEQLKVTLSETPARKPIKSQPVQVDLKKMNNEQRINYFLNNK